jgi:glycosyltransferase involved in cell wall biosynthesis
MRILHVIPQFAYFGGRTIIGGYSSAVLELSLAQAAVGHEVTVLGYVPAESGRGRIEEGVDVISIFEDADPGSTSFGLKFLRAAPKWVREHARRFDVVHNHSGFADYLLVGGAIARKTPLPVAHTMYCPIPHRGGRWNLPGVPGVLRRGARRMNVITAMSQNVATSMEQFGLGPVVAVPPAVDLEPSP